MARAPKTMRNEFQGLADEARLPQVLAFEGRGGLVLATLLLAALWGALPSSTYAQTPAGKADLSRMVVVGDSLSAGFQNDSLLDTQQPHGWASLVAAQANVPLALPLIAPPGVPNVLELITGGPVPIIQQAPGPPSIGRDDPTVQATDLAVPGADLQDALTTRPSLPIADLTDMVLGPPGVYQGVSRSQVEWAEALQPTTVFVWIGNNDILAAAIEANPSAATSIASFSSNYSKLLDQLTATGATIVVADIPDVTVVPFFTSASAIEKEIGLPPLLVSLILGIGPNDYVLPTGIERIPSILANPSLGPLPSSDVLRATQVLQIRALIGAYNLIIAIEAIEHGAVFVDIHSLTDQIRSQGVEANGLHLTNGYLGGLFSLDGVHPTNTGYAVIANEFITALNQARGTSVPLVDINQVASEDPLVFGDANSTVDSLGRHVSTTNAGALLPLLSHTQP